MRRIPNRSILDRSSAHWSTLLVLAVLVALCTPTFAQAPPPGPAAGSQPEGRPPVVVEPELVDFGLVDPSSRHPAVFRIRNVGRDPLTISGAVPSCRCTTMDGIAGQVIEPGATFELKADLEAPSYPGVKESRVTLVFRGHRVPINVTLRCDVMLPIRVVEEFVDALNEKHEGTVVVESRDGAPFRLLRSNGGAPDFVDFDPTSDEPRSRYVVRWSVRDWPCEGMRLWWIFETDRKDAHVLPARIRHECTGARADPNRFTRRWMMTEQIVNAGRIKAGETIRLSAEVENSEPKAGARRPATFDLGFRQISAVTSRTPEATARLVHVEPGGELDATVHFEFTPDADARGLVYAIVRFSSPNGDADIAVVASVEAP